MSEQSTGETERCGDGLIILKCHGCKAATLFKMVRCHEAEDHEFRARSYCTRCIQDDPLNQLMYRKLDPALVDNQQMDLGCHVPNWSVQPGTEHGGDT